MRATPKLLFLVLELMREPRFHGQPQRLEAEALIVHVSIRAEDKVRYRYGLMGASVGQCLMSNIVHVVGPDEEGISI